MSKWKSLNREQRIEAIREAANLSPRKSAAAYAETLSAMMGETLSRNVVIGMRDRYKDELKDVHLRGDYPEHPKPVDWVAIDEKRRRKFRKHFFEGKTMYAKTAKRAPAAKSVAKKVVPIIDLSPDAISIEPKALVDLERGECKYSVGGDHGRNFVFCAQPTHGHYAYCPDHQKRVFLS